MDDGYKSYHHQDQFDLGRHGKFCLTWPDRMSDSELQDFNDWIDLMKTKINRIAGSRISIEDIGENKVLVRHADGSTTTVHLLAGAPTPSEHNSE